MRRYKYATEYRYYYMFTEYAGKKRKFTLVVTLSGMGSLHYIRSMRMQKHVKTT